MSSTSTIQVVETDDGRTGFEPSNRLTGVTVPASLGLRTVVAGAEAR